MATMNAVKHRITRFVRSVATCVGALALALSGSAMANPTLERDVLPILTKQCMGCHGGLVKKADLDFRTMQSMLKGGKSGPALVAGKPGQSNLWVQIADGDMPKGDKKLSPEEKETIRKWIAAGLPTVAQQQIERDPLLSPDKQHAPDEVAKVIDRHIDAKLKDEHLTAAPISDDAEFLRRVYLDLIGRVPTSEQAVRFLDDTSTDKRTRLIDALLAKPEFGEQMGRAWRDWICPPELPSDMNGGKQPHNEARALGIWFAERFTTGDPWDKIVRDLLTVKGEVKKNPQGIYFGLVGQNAKITPDGTARTVASLFMGVQLQCAQCHDDPYRDWSQNEFWSFAAFFNNVNGNYSKIDEKAGDKHIQIPTTAFKNVGTKLSVSFLRDDKKLTKEKAEWRPVLVDWLTAKDNPYFARAFANRMWAYFFARGIVNPIDDFRDLNPPTHPGLMALLGNEFTASGFDVRHLLRCICNSQAYQRTTRTDAKQPEAERVRQTELFGRAPMRVMNADVLFESLKLVYGDEKLDLRTIDKEDGNTNGESAAVGDPLLEFHRQFGTNEEDATDFTHGIPQMLTFINHPRLMQGSKALDGFLKQESKPSPDQAIEWLYLSTLSRRPTSEEVKDAKEYVMEAAKEDDPFAGLNDVLWMLVNRSEFILIR